MILKNFKMFTRKGFEDINDTCSPGKVYMDSHTKFQERLKKTLYYGKYADGTLPSPIVTDVAVKLINSRTSGKKPLDKCQAARITRRARISPCALMMGILYTERLAQNNPCYLKKVSSSDLFLVSMLVASKYLYDDGEEEDAYNYDWCKAGNYHIRDLNRLERDFLSSIGWKVFVSCKEFFEFVNKIESRIAVDQGMERGWYSYLDMHTLFENSQFHDLLTKCLKNSGKTILGCTLAYSLSVALLLSTSACFSSKNSFSPTVSHELLPKVLPPMSFVGQIGQAEHSFKTSKWNRERSMGLKGSFCDSQQNRDIGRLRTNNTQTAGFTTEQTCDTCISDKIAEGQKDYVLNQLLSVTLREPRCILGAQCHDKNTLWNVTVNNEETGKSFSQLLSFLKFPFHHYSWFHGPLRYPMWENGYSDILIGFSTSIATAAAA